MGSNSLYYARIYNINLGGKKNNMGAIEILLISIGLAMDAFAVSVCKGLAMKKNELEKGCNYRIVFWNISSCNASYRLFFRDYV